MANEVIIEEYETYDPSIPIATIPHKTQFLNIGTRSAQFSSKTQYVIIKSKTTAFQYAFGDVAVTATANTTPSIYIGANGVSEPRKVGRDLYLNSVADA